METSSEEGEQATSKIFLPLLLSLLFLACKKTIHEMKPVKVNHVQKTIIDTIQKTTTALPKKKKKKLYLTFDDGPNKGSSKVLHIAEEEQVPISMFIIGEHVYASRYQTEVFDSIENSGLVEICNHSYTHAWQNHYEKFYSNPDSAVKDFARCADSLHLENKIVRMPGRNIWRTENTSSTDIKRSASTGDSLESAGYSVIGWDLEWTYDGKNLELKMDADSILKEIDTAYARNLTKYPDHLVFLAHDQVYADPNDSAQLHMFIRKLKQKDYELLTISKYPGASQ
ncbi:MAG: hypothetical protein C5B52_07485 [Bacteroidetes bacterium]|nr:MAG: hypothetical protein C5B52_07485 [Bacteroidota bacterium]